MSIFFYNFQPKSKRKTFSPSRFFSFLYLLLVINKHRFSKQQPHQEHQSSRKKGDNPNLEIRSTQNSEVIRSRHRHITLMLLSVAGVFLLLTLPNSIYFVLDLTYGFNKRPTENNYDQWLRYRRLTILTVIMFQLSDLQHATNFFLYLLSSDKFRRSVLMIFTTSGHFLSTLFNCRWQEKDNSSTAFPKHYSSQRYGNNALSFRSSATEVSSTTFNSRNTSNRQGSQALYKYRSIVSKPAPKLVTAST